MLGATRTIVLTVLLAAIVAAPTSTANASPLRDAFAPPAEGGAADGSVHCTGFAPLTPYCGVSFSATRSISTSVSGTFTGDLTCRFTGPYGSWLQYRILVVGGLAITATTSGPGLYAGSLVLACEAQGPFGAGGTLGGVGNYDVRVDFT